MNDVERFLDQACCGVGGSHELLRPLRKELHEHLAAEYRKKCRGQFVFIGPQPVRYRASDYQSQQSDNRRGTLILPSQV